jgi:hypothetical protein
MTPIAVAIVNYNTREHLRACPATVQPAAPSATVVVDTAASADDGAGVQCLEEVINRWS